MKISIRMVCLICCCIALNANAQVLYKSGFATVSIEPSKYPFSLTLAGYGYPREGRFSLDWVKKGSLTNGSVFAGNETAFFTISEGRLLMSTATASLNWKNIGSAHDISLLAANKTTLYAVNKNGELQYSATSGRLNWKKIGNVQNLLGLSALDHVLYAADRQGVISFSDLREKTLNWKKLSTLSGLISIAAYEDQLYALTADDDLMKLDLKQKNAAWTKIARYNGVSYDVHLQSIAIVNHSLYGLTRNYEIFEGRHLTDGDLSVTALAVAAGKQTVVLVGADLCGLGHDFVDLIKQEIAKKYALPAAAIMVNSSHTHFGPVAQQWPAWPEFVQQPDHTYMNKILRPAIVKAVGTAIKTMKPADLYFGRGKTSIGLNRSLSGDYIPYDNDVDVLSIIRQQDHQKTVLFLTACHAVFKNEGAESFTISPNFPGVTRKLLKDSMGIANTMFIQGCGGDINPVDENHWKTGAALAANVSKVLNQPMEKLKGSINFHLDSISFPVKQWTISEIQAFRKENDNNNQDVEAEKNVRWADYMLQLRKKNKMPVAMPVYIQTFNIGNWKIVGLSREAVTDYSIGIKKLWPEQLVSVAGYCNDVSSYLPTWRHIKARTYEGYGSFFWYGQPSLFPESVYETVIDKIKTQNH